MFYRTVIELTEENMPVFPLTLVLGLLLDLLERVEPLADAVDVEVLEAEVLPLLQVQVVEHALQQLPPQACPL